MKKKLMFLLVALILGSQMVFGQGSPCAIFDQSRDIEGMREILILGGTYHDNLRSAYAEAVNYQIGENVISPDKKGMKMLLDSTILFDASFVVPEDYLNGVKYGKNISFTNLKGQPSKNWAGFRYKGVDYIYAKVSCMNPQKIKLKPKAPVKPEPEYEPEQPKPKTKNDTIVEKTIIIRETQIIEVERKQSYQQRDCGSIGYGDYAQPSYGGGYYPQRPRISLGVRIGGQAGRPMVINNNNYNVVNNNQRYRPSYRPPVRGSGQGSMSGGRPYNGGSMSGGRGSMSGGRGG